MPKAATISRALAQSFSQRAPEVPEERGDSLESPGANRPYKATAVKIDFGRTAASLLKHCDFDSLIVRRDLVRLGLDGPCGGGNDRVTINPWQFEETDAPTGMTYLSQSLVDRKFGRAGIDDPDGFHLFVFHKSHCLRERSLDSSIIYDIITI